MINRVQYRQDSVVIDKDGKPVAALIDARLFERIRKMQDRFEELGARLAKAYAGVPEQEGMAEIERAVRRERGRKPTPARKRSANRRAATKG